MTTTRFRAHAGYKNQGQQIRVGIDCKPFQIPRCASCREPLADDKGNPRWDILEDRFVCLGSCAPMRRFRRG